MPNNCLQPEATRQQTNCCTNVISRGTHELKQNHVFGFSNKLPYREINSPMRLVIIILRPTHSEPAKNHRHTHHHRHHQTAPLASVSPRHFSDLTPRANCQHKTCKIYLLRNFQTLKNILLPRWRSSSGMADTTTPANVPSRSFQFAGGFCFALVICASLGNDGK